MDAFTITSLTLITILGASIGSFANVVAYRLPNNKNINNPPSHCPNCQRKLTPLELVPVLSWIALRAKCHGCKTKISPRYPIVEILFAIAYLGLALLTQPDLTSGGELARFALQAASISMLLMAALIDLDTKMLPDTLVYGALGTGLLASLFTANPAAPEYLSAPAGQTITIALAAAGALALMERYATLAMRRLKPVTGGQLINNDHLLTGALTATIFGVLPALGVTASLILIDTTTRKRYRIPQSALLALIPAAIAAMHYLGKPALTGLMQALATAGAVALAAGVAWWISDAIANRNPQPVTDDDLNEVTLGFGDVKLAAALAAILPNPTLLVLGLLLASLTGTLHSVTARQRALPFGPHLLLGSILAATIGPSITNWYSAITGIPLL